MSTYLNVPLSETESPTTDGADPTDTANTMAEWVIKYDLGQL